jgi:stage IV sporulation protein B
MGGHKKKRRNAPVRAENKVKKIMGSLLALLIVLSYFTPEAQALRAFPQNLSISLGQTRALHMGIPFTVSSSSDEVAVLSSGDERLNEVVLSGSTSGQTELTFNFLGLIPFKKMQVDVRPEMRLIPGGEALGVALQTKGVLVVGTSDLGGNAGASPARISGIKPGDVILSVADIDITSTAHLSKVLAEIGEKQIPIRISRDEKIQALQLTPKRDSATGTYRLGAWVRDSTAGVGTLSFYDPETGGYGALGHAITDNDTLKPLSVSEGQVLKADIVDVRKGQKGTPGELKGSFLREKRMVGDITQNSVLGIYGKLSRAPEKPLYPEGLPVGLRSAVHTGPATIISTVDAAGPKEYQIEITQVTNQNTPAPKSMVLKVTDPALLEKTGGIVQGMSGSPILQDGHIIGAVTHVFVSDPTQGYGLYIEWMLDRLKAQ